MSGCLNWCKLFYINYYMIYLLLNIKLNKMLVMIVNLNTSQCIPFLLVLLSIDSFLLLVDPIKNLAEVIYLLVDVINCVFEFFGSNSIISL